MLTKYLPHSAEVLADSLIRRDAEEILSGKISVNPCKTGGTVPCTYCPYRDACGFDPKTPGYGYREIGKA